MKTSLIIALTADGKIAKTSSHGADWTSKEDKQFFVSKTKELGVVIMGSSTYLTINRPLPDRLNIVLTKSPEEYDSIHGVLEFTNQTPGKILKDLETRGHSQAAIIGGATINSLFLEAGLIDELYLTIEPILFGQGISLFSKDINESKLQLLDTKKLSDNVILIHYQVIK